MVGYIHLNKELEGIRKLIVQKIECSNSTMHTGNCLKQVMKAARQMFYSFGIFFKKHQRHELFLMFFILMYSFSKFPMEIFGFVLWNLCEKADGFIWLL